MNFVARLLDHARRRVRSLLAAGTASAQQPQNTVARLKDIQGNVLVSQGDAMVTAPASNGWPSAPA